ncbi:MAG: tetratricopeptide repeat protein [Anaerolineae bacterium]|nr:tetratricopeptide repeat protein [Anaerolineae bacterium]
MKNNQSPQRASKSLDQLVQAGAQHIERGDFEQAIAVWKEAMQLAPDSPESHILLTIAYIHEYSIDSAVKSWQEVIRIDQDGEPEARQRILAETSSPQLVNAVVAQAYCRTAQSHSARRELELAKAACQHSLEVDASNPEVHQLLGCIYGEQDRYAEAAESFVKAIQLKPDYLLAYENFFTLLVECGQRNEADALWHKAIEIDPAYEIGSRLLMRAKSLAGFFEQVIVKHVMEPRGTFPMKTPASKFYSQEEFDQIMHHAHHFQAGIELQRENVEGAICEFRKALENDPDDLDAHYGLASSYSALNRRDEAAAEWQQVLRLSPDNKEAHKYLKKAGRRKRFWLF